MCNNEIKLRLFSLLQMNVKINMAMLMHGNTAVGYLTCSPLLPLVSININQITCTYKCIYLTKVFLFS